MFCSLYATGRYMYMCMSKRNLFEFPNIVEPDEMADRASSGSTGFAV